MAQIVLVEDNPDNSDLIDAFLGDAHNVKAFKDGFSVLSWLKSSQVIPNIFMFDISLPEMDGIELLMRIRLINTLSDIPAIAVTSHAMKGDKERFLAAGFAAYVSKPIDEDSLLMAIKRAGE